MYDELRQLVKDSIEAVERMTPEEREAMFKAQRESWVRAEMSWPKAQFHYAGDGTKVYHSYEDYVND